MSVLVDTAQYPAHGRVWAHLASDASPAELHAFAARLGIPARSFEGDHYDIPAESVAAAVALGARQVSTRELLLRLRASGLRTPKRRGEKVLSTTTGATGRVDVVRAGHLPPPHGTHVLLHLDAGVPAVEVGAVGVPVVGLPAPGERPGAVAGAGHRVLGFRRRWSSRDGETRTEHDGLLLSREADALPRDVLTDLLPGAGAEGTADDWWWPLLADAPPRT